MSSPGTLIVVGGDDIQPAKKVDYYDLKANRWLNAFSIDTSERFDFNSILLDGKLILLGGESFRKRMETLVTSYDFETGETTEMPSFSVKGSDLYVAVVSRHLYVIGGYDSAFITRVERYSPFTNTWEFVEPLSKGRYNCGITVLNGEIYLVGGYRPSSSLDLVEAYNPIHGSWRQCSSMKEVRDGPAVAALGGFIYAVGGSAGIILTYTAERYDPVVDKWTYIENPILPRRRGNAEVFNGSMIITGGYDASVKMMDDVESYDPEKGEWSLLASLNEPRILFDLLRVPWSPNELGKKVNL